MIGGAPLEELEWLAANGKLLSIERGHQLSKPGESIDSLYILLSGHVAFYVDRGGGQRKVIEWHGGDVSGVLPYSRMKGSPGAARAEAQTDIWAVPRARFHEMTTVCPEVTGILVHVMVDRARQFTSVDLQDEKTLALGKLAAGMAHELNNPASAIVRSAKDLANGLSEIEAAARALGALRLGEEQLATIARVREACLALPSRSWTPLERADREDEIAEWVRGHGGDDAPAAQLAETAVTTEQLEHLATTLRGEELNVALRWVGTGCSTRNLAIEIERGASRVFDMVSAVKGFTHMDRAMVAAPVVIGEGIRNAVTVLRAKAAAKEIEIAVDIEADLPTVLGMAGECNQIWASLIDNAIDAVEHGGTVSVAVRREGRRVIVEVVDDGPGIPADIRGRIFDPFFTTKEPGQGVGLGLDVARRSLERHDGEITVESRPGRTMFRVSLPAEGARSTGRYSRGVTRIQIDDQ